MMPDFAVKVNYFVYNILNVFMVGFAFLLFLSPLEGRFWPQIHSPRTALFMPRKSPVNWTDEDKKFIQEHCNKEGVRYCAKMVGHPYSSTIVLARTLGFVSKIKCHKWTTEETNYLQENIGQLGATKCAQYLNLPLKSVKHKAWGNKFKGTGMLKKERNPLWQGYGEISGSVLTNIRKGATARNLSCDISIKQIWELFLAQNRKCALSGKDIYFSSTCKSYDGTASLDRINSSKGYIIDNVQWVHKWVNLMKQDMDDQEFIDWCHAISSFKKA